MKEARLRRNIRSSSFVVMLGEGVDGIEAMGCAGWVVGADRAVVAA
jgi:hypothetical protein